MEKEFHKSWMYIQYAIRMLALNMDIVITSKIDRINFDDDPYYRDYDRFTPVSKHGIMSFKEYINSQQYKLDKHIHHDKS